MNKKTSNTPQKTKLERNTYGVDEKLEQEFNFSHLKRSLKYVKKYAGKMTFALTLALIATIVTLLGPTIISITIDEVLTETGKYYKNTTALIILGVSYLVCMAIAVLLTAWRAIIISKVGQNIILDIRNDLFAHLQELPFSYYDSRPLGKILVRVTSYVAAVSDMLSNGIINAIIDIITIIIILVFMLMTNVSLTIPALCGIPILFIFLSILKPAQRRAHQHMSNKRSNLTAYTCENIEGVKVTEIFDREEKNQEIYADLAEQYSASWKRAIRIQSIIPNVSSNISQWAQTSVYIVAFYTMNVGASIGTVIAMAGYASRFWAPISNLTSIYSTVINGMAYLERIFETLDYPSDITDAPDAYKLPAIKGEVEFKDVYFGYDPNIPILKGVSFKAMPGQSFALVGPTGAGKSTIVNLISRFYDIDSGSVTIDGNSVSKVTLNSLRSQMGIMLQDPFIFSGTIEDNIRYGKLDATEDEIIAAAKTVCAHDFIMSLPDGYKTVVRERGSGLSQGQKQLISLARTLIGNPSILVLDEATSSVDARTEQLLQTAVNKLMEGRTSFIVAHRLSTIKSCDKILFIDDGRIAESGTHDELLDKKGRYYDLYTAQSIAEDSQKRLAEKDLSFSEIDV